MKNIKKIVIGIIVLGLIFVYAHVDNMMDLYDINIDPSQYLSTGVIYDGELRQTFTSKEEKLDGVSLKSSIVGDCSNITLEYKLLDDSGNVVASGSADAQKIKDKKFYKYKFEQIKNCKNKEYTFVMKEKGATEVQGIAFYIDPTINNSQVYNNTNNAEGALVAKVISHRFDMKTYIIVLVFILYLVGFTKLLYKLFR